jgi:hypothetical protein
VSKISYWSKNIITLSLRAKANQSPGKELALGQDFPADAGSSYDKQRNRKPLITGSVRRAQPLSAFHRANEQLRRSGNWYKLPRQNPSRSGERHWSKLTVNAVFGARVSEAAYRGSLAAGILPRSINGFHSRPSLGKNPALVLAMGRDDFHVVPNIVSLPASALAAFITPRTLQFRFNPEELRRPYCYGTKSH